MGDRVDVQLDDGTGRGGFARYEGPRPPVSVVILTYNEEGNIAECIRSCAWSDDIHVLDSGSTDGTAEIARSLGAQVHVHRFKSFGDQRNWAIDHIPCKHPWHFHLDADERFTPGVIREMVDLIGIDGERGEHVCYLCPSKMIFLGRWLKRSGNYPSYQVRLFRYGKCRFMDFGHGQREDPQGSVGTMKQPYMHYAFSKGLLEWMTKHNGYSEREAREGLAIRAARRPPLRTVFQNDGIARRRAAKNLSYFLPMRAVWRFLYSFVARMGFLDGLAGMHYCLMISMYEYWIELKIRELRERWSLETDEHIRRMLEESAARVGDDPGARPAGTPIASLRPDERSGAAAATPARPSGALA
ncbi:MAG: glycosyltransferase family 2 protein [Phycisphaerales bacterium]